MIESMHRDIFKKWEYLSSKIESLKGIVQNPVSMTEGQIKEWREVAYKNWMEYSDLVKETLKCLRDRYDVYIHPESDSIWVEVSADINLYRIKDPLVEKIGENLSLDEAIKLMNERS